MDLEEFDHPVDHPGSVNFSGDQAYIKGLKLLDDRWFVKATRSARWMDLLGDYAGTEPFVIDGWPSLSLLFFASLILLRWKVKLSFRLYSMIHCFLSGEKVGFRILNSGFQTS